jgi:hypothetical protein
MPEVARAIYDTVLAMIGWDVDGNLRIEEDNGWESPIAWAVPPVNFEFFVPKAQRPENRKKKAPVPVFLDQYEA